VVLSNSAGPLTGRSRRQRNRSTAANRESRATTPASPAGRPTPPCCTSLSASSRRGKPSPCLCSRARRFPSFPPTAATPWLPGRSCRPRACSITGSPFPDWSIHLRRDEARRTPQSLPRAAAPL